MDIQFISWNESQSQVITEEVPCGFFLRTAIVNRGNSCELKPRKKKRSCPASMAKFISVLKVSKRTNPLKLVKSGQFFSMQIIEFPSAKQQRNIFDTIITRPCKYELSGRTEVVLNDAIFHQSSS